MKFLYFVPLIIMASCANKKEAPVVDPVTTPAQQLMDIHGNINPGVQM